jgi:uncharacterized protein YkwD
MRLVSRAVVALSSFLLVSACGKSTNVSDESVALSAYVGVDGLQAIFANSRVYAISEQPLQNVVIGVNGQSKSVSVTTQAQSNKPAYATSVLTLAVNDLVHVTAKSSGGQNLSLVMRAVADGDGMALKVSNEPIPQQQPLAGNEVDEQAFLAYFNNWRAQHGLSPVQLSRQLTLDSARNNDLQVQYGLGHHYMGSAQGQNAAWNYPSTESVMNGWEHSSGHYANMIGHWKCMGIHKKGAYWTQSFSSPASCD